MASSALLRRSIVCGVFLLQGALAGAETVTFTAMVGDAKRVATVEVEDHDGVAYVRLGLVSRQFRGGFRLFPARAKIDLAESTAWIGINNTEVDASFGRFSLRHPALRHEGDVLMALSDTGPFFEKSFGLKVSQKGPDAPGTRPAGPSRGTVQDLEYMAEPETIELADLPQRVTRTRRIEVIVIDPGHGGEDDGVVGPSGLKEKDLAMATSAKLKAALEKALNVRVMLTRRQDINTPIAVRANAAGLQRADLFISIHAGASQSASAHGFELFLPDEEAFAEALALRPVGERVLDRRDPRHIAAQSLAIASAVADALKQTAEAKNRGIRTARCRATGNLTVPGFLIEVGCLTNAAEEALLQDEAYQAKLAEGLAQGISNYVTGNTGTVGNE
jgi:N-acetylmuramoyl-L-alanine amidase